MSALWRIADSSRISPDVRKVPISEVCRGSRSQQWQRRLLVRRIALKRLFCDPSNSVEYDAVTNPYCSRRSDHGVDPSARELAEIADLQPVVANECPKNIRILG